MYSIHNKKQNKIVKNNIEDNQLIFVSGKLTRKALLELRILLERHLELNRSTYVVFIDIEKTFANMD